VSSVSDEVVDLKKFEIFDHNITSEYVTYIVDLWEGDKNDPAVSITRYIGVWRGDQLEKEDGEAFDPDFWGESRSRYTYRLEPKPKPLAWTTVETVKEADKELLSFKTQQENMLNKNQYYGKNRRAELYQEFLDAIDILALWPDREDMWKKVEAYRRYNAHSHEK
jgi:hypothetical protein